MFEEHLRYPLASTETDPISDSHIPNAASSLPNDDSQHPSDEDSRLSSREELRSGEDVESLPSDEMRSPCSDDSQSLTNSESQPLPSGESQPLTGGESQPLTGGETEPLLGVESQPLLSDESQPLLSDESQPLLSDASLAQFMNRQQESLSEFAEAFERDAAEEPTPARLLEEVIRSRRRMEVLQGDVRRLQQRMRASSSLLFLLVVSLGVLFGWSFRSGKWPPWSDRVIADANGAPENNLTTSGGTDGANLAGNPASTSAAQLAIDQRYMERVHSLYRQARQFGTQLEQANSGDPDSRAKANEDYLQFMVELSEVSEQAATEENVSQATRTAIVNIATVAKEIRDTRGIVGLETQALMKQIEDAIYPDRQLGDRGF